MTMRLKSLLLGTGDLKSMFSAISTYNRAETQEVRNLIMPGPMNVTRYDPPLRWADMVTQEKVSP